MNFLESENVAQIEIGKLKVEEKKFKFTEAVKRRHGDEWTNNDGNTGGQRQAEAEAEMEKKQN